MALLKTASSLLKQGRRINQSRHFSVSPRGKSWTETQQVTCQGAQKVRVTFHTINSSGCLISPPNYRLDNKSCVSITPRNAQNLNVTIQNWQLNTRFYDSYGLCASHRWTETRAYHNCSLWKILNIRFYETTVAVFYLFDQCWSV